MPSDSKPMLPPSTSPPAVNIIALSSSVDSLSVIVTVVATAAVPEYPDDVIVPSDALASLNVIVPPSAFSSMFASASRVILPELSESISAILGVVNVLLVSVSVDTKDTKV